MKPDILHSEPISELFSGGNSHILSVLDAALDVRWEVREDFLEPPQYGFCQSTAGVVLGDVCVD